MGLGRHQVQHLTVAYALRQQRLRGREQRAVGAAQNPAAVSFAVVGQPSPACRSTSGSNSARGTCSGRATSTRRWGALMVTRASPVVID
ncbi:hypothetical protein GCM10027614_52610 [Micromonospora vulcania]